MLKIKDNVDLKELEEFGFKYDENYGVWKWDRLDKDGIPFYQVYITKRHHNIQIRIGYVSYIAHRLQELLYDLIQAGLVEKVSED